MPRENSFSDDGRSLTPDLEDELKRERNGGVLSAPASSKKAKTLVSPPQSPGTHDHRIFPKLNTLSPARTVKPSVTPSRPWNHLTPKDKFRALVRKVIFVNRGTSFLQAGGVRFQGEPGINPRRKSAEILYGHIHESCTIEIVDYSAVRNNAMRMSNQEFVNFLNSPKASERDPWVKVRWINIGGLSWDVIKAVSLRYDLHPLSIEDVFHIRGQNRSKVDYYSKHIFMRVICHDLIRNEVDNTLFGPPSHFSSVLSSAPRSMSPEPFVENGKGTSTMDEIHSEGDPLTPKKKRRFLPLRAKTISDLEQTMVLRTTRGGMFKRRTVDSGQFLGNAAQVALDTLKQGQRINVKLSPLFIFLLRGGIVITIHPTPDLRFTSPISNRLHQTDTTLRASADPSLLVHALLDLVVDNALEVIDEYHSMINKFERDILLKPNIETVRYIHILSGDLILHKRTLEPIKTLVYGLRRYDVDRCTALIDTNDPANKDVKVIGFMSHKAKIYLADVNDHMEYALNSLDMFSAIAENLVNYTFNLTSYQTNEFMRMLTLATIICLPLTLLTGYFGMNFATMWSVQQNSDLFFWKIAIPIMAVIIPLFTIPDIKRAIHYLSKKLSTERAIKNLRET